MTEISERFCDNLHSFKVFLRELIPVPTDHMRRSFSKQDSSKLQIFGREKSGITSGEKQNKAMRKEAYFDFHHLFFLLSMIPLFAYRRICLEMRSVHSDSAIVRSRLLMVTIGIISSFLILNSHSTRNVTYFRDRLLGDGFHLQIL
uniref:Uncharacterized protein n=1 Tax=Parascaris univalens TaxID=6257 RepID=A0A915BD24_PARUN